MHVDDLSIFNENWCVKLDTAVCVSIDFVGDIALVNVADESINFLSFSCIYFEDFTKALGGHYKSTVSYLFREFVKIIAEEWISNKLVLE